MKVFNLKKLLLCFECVFANVQCMLGIVGLER